MFRSSFWIDEHDPKNLETIFFKLLRDSEFQILNFDGHLFDPFGWTGVWTLGESHLAIHTFPENDTAYVELTSCNFDKYLKFMREFISIYDILLRKKEKEDEKKS